MTADGLLQIGLFFLVPVGLTNLFRDSLPNSLVFVVVEKAIRIAIFASASASSISPAKITRRWS